MSNYIDELISSYDTVIISVADDASAAVASKLRSKNIKTIVISVLSPVPSMRMKSWANTILMAYSYSEYSFMAAFGALAGEYQVTGKFPLAEE